jgi:hypothetical protein
MMRLMWEKGFRWARDFMWGQPPRLSAERSSTFFF